MSFEEHEIAVKEIGEPSFRAKQIYSWLHSQCVTSFDEMTNISKALRQKLDDNFVIFGVSIEKKLVSEYDDTQKYLFRLHDGEFIESVLMKYKYGYTLCVSTQVGCRMGCKFCASTLDGVVRNLTASEILSQIYEAQRDNDIKISHTVLMGMGEPLDNYDNVMRFLELITDEKGQNMSMRHISLSTCGLVPGIRRLAEEDLPITLSISLHAVTDEKRSAIMPVNRKYGIDALLSACRRYYDKTGRRISFEYTLIAGKNDSRDAAEKLAAVLNGKLRPTRNDSFPVHVNLIPVNAVEESGCQPPSKKALEAFAAVLTQRGIKATIRRKLGPDINASCGQLRRTSMQN